MTGSPNLTESVFAAAVALADSNEPVSVECPFHLQCGAICSRLVQTVRHHCGHLATGH
jgi:hypothetical protein